MGLQLDCWSNGGKGSRAVNGGPSTPPTATVTAAVDVLVVVVVVVVIHVAAVVVLVAAVVVIILVVAVVVIVAVVVVIFVAAIVVLVAVVVVVAGRTGNSDSACGGSGFGHNKYLMHVALDFRHGNKLKHNITTPCRHSTSCSYCSTALALCRCNNLLLYTSVSASTCCCSGRCANASISSIIETGSCRSIRCIALRFQPNDILLNDSSIIT